MEEFSYKQLVRELTPLYGIPEARAVARLALYSAFGLKMTDVVMGADKQLPREETEKLVQRLLAGEPVQYAVGKAEFAKRWFTVSPGVLIPRPETQEMTLLINALESERRKPRRVLDIGTGSGCIAITLALDMEASVVTAFDISDRALAIARGNAERLGAEVDFQKFDILKGQPSGEQFDIIVSNPPYVCESEKREMDPNVLNFEPAEALFVPDDDPLLFYRPIVNFAATALSHGGSLYLEVNSRYAEEVAALMSGEVFEAVEVIPDMFGRPRFVTCRKI